MPKRNRLTVDLHGKRTTEVESAILKGISDAHLADVSTIVFVHGFNRGTSLSKECQRALAELQKQGIVQAFQIQPGNPGETVVRLSES